MILDLLFMAVSLGVFLIFFFSSGLSKLTRSLDCLLNGESQAGPAPGGNHGGTLCFWAQPGTPCSGCLTQHPQAAQTFLCCHQTPSTAVQSLVSLLMGTDGCWLKTSWSCHGTRLWHSNVLLAQSSPWGIPTLLRKEREQLSEQQMLPKTLAKLLYAT